MFNIPTPFTTCKPYFSLFSDSIVVPIKVLIDVIGIGFSDKYRIKEG